MTLLDSHAATFPMQAQPIAAVARECIERATPDDPLLVSPVTAWEIGNLIRHGRAQGVSFHADPVVWFHRLTSGPAVRVAAFSIDIALESAFLPGDFHDDPGDRLLVATARHLKVPLMTRDRRILSYAQAGYLRVIEC